MGWNSGSVASGGYVCVLKSALTGLGTTSREKGSNIFLQRFHDWPELDSTVAMILFRCPQGVHPTQE